MQATWRLQNQQFCLFLRRFYRLEDTTRPVDLLKILLLGRDFMKQKVVGEGMLTPSDVRQRNRSFG